MDDKTTTASSSGAGRNFSFSIVDILRSQPAHKTDDTWLHPRGQTPANLLKSIILRQQKNNYVIC